MYEYSYDDDDNNDVEVGQEFRVGLDNLKHVAIFDNDDQETYFNKISFAIVRFLNEQNINLDGNDIVIIKKGSVVAPNMKFKNVTCFILGYYITSTSKAEININRLKKVVKTIPNLPFKVSTADILRYGFFWTGIIWPELEL